MTLYPEETTGKLYCFRKPVLWQCCEGGQDHVGPLRLWGIHQDPQHVHNGRKRFYQRPRRWVWTWTLISRWVIVSLNTNSRRKGPKYWNINSYTKVRKNEFEHVIFYQVRNSAFEYELLYQRSTSELLYIYISRSATMRLNMNSDA